MGALFIHAEELLSSCCSRVISTLPIRIRYDLISSWNLGIPTEVLYSIHLVEYMYVGGRRSELFNSTRIYFLRMHAIQTTISASYG